ncbi:2,3-diphosphoglycerate-dependent phosphoglycerate mutase [Candidatus Roizmanbacteria bacterium]|nr:MAG: 2,3-diphosphoglycerate-dependent phosphoglycerate mutase [Candidatus Roizmanbacteria bacterium]
MSYLVLVRHGISEWNKLGLWTGWKDPELSPEGYEEAKKAAESIQDIPLDKAYTADLQRTKETTKTILKALGKSEMETVITPAVRERNYGDLAGKNKWVVKEEYGEEQFTKWRRGWDEPIPNGESLKDVYERLLPYYKEHIEPELKSGKNILVSASGNSLRALVKYLEDIPDNEIAGLEIGTGEVYVYQMDDQAKITEKQIRSSNPKKGKV